MVKTRKGLLSILGSSNIILVFTLSPVALATNLLLITSILTCFKEVENLNAFWLFSSLFYTAPALESLKTSKISYKKGNII